MEYPVNEAPTPYFGKRKFKTDLLEGLLAERMLKSTNELSQYVKNEDKEKNINEKNNERSKNKKKSKEKSKSKKKSSKSKKKKNFGKSLPIKQKYENPLIIFLNKKLELRNDFDQNNTEKFLSEKELAFQQFRMNEDDNCLDN